MVNIEKEHICPAIQEETVMLMVCTSRSVSEVSLRIVILGFLEASQL